MIIVPSSDGSLVSVSDSPSLGADFHMDSRILNHIDTRSRMAGMQHAAARSIAVLDVSLFGAGMT